MQAIGLEGTMVGPPPQLVPVQEKDNDDVIIGGRFSDSSGFSDISVNGYWTCLHNCHVNVIVVTRRRELIVRD